MQQSQSPLSPSTSLYAAILDMDSTELDAFRARLRRRYGRDELIEELRACAARIGASPTMREFAEDPDATIHPQTVVDHFGSWNAAKREAGLMPRRRATREELLEALRALGEELGRRPTTRDIEDARGRVPSRGVYSKAFGSMREALALAGFDTPSRDERLGRSVDHGAAFYLRTGRLPSFRDWERIRGGREDVMTAWQLYRTFEKLGGAWSAFQFAIDERARELQGATLVAA
jgi:hypothetical protein